MTRKDYVKLAAAFAATEPPFETSPAYYAWRAALEAVGAVLAADNPRFDWGRFMYAASGGDAR